MISMNGRLLVAAVHCKADAPLRPTLSFDSAQPSVREGSNWASQQSRPSALRVLSLTVAEDSQTRCAHPRTVQRSPPQLHRTLGITRHRRFAAYLTPARQGQSEGGLVSLALASIVDPPRGRWDPWAPARARSSAIPVPSCPRTTSPSPGPASGSCRPAPNGTLAASLTSPRYCGGSIDR